MATKKAAKKATKKATKKTAKKTAKKAPAKKEAPRKAAAKKAAPKKAAPKKAAPKKAAPKKAAPKKAARKVAKKSAAKKAITPRKALSNTRKLLEAKQRQARKTPAWQQIGSPSTQGEEGYQSPEAAEKAQELHEAEIRLDGIQGSISTHVRHAQGRRDSR